MFAVEFAVSTNYLVLLHARANFIADLLRIPATCGGRDGSGNAWGKLCNAA
jgi:hypothetical protein